MSIHLRSVSEIVQADLCAGCGLCESIGGSDSIRMEIDGEGFYRPNELNHNDKAWQTILETCPGIVITQEAAQSNSPQEKLWGPLKESLVGWATDDEMRWSASSGGALSGLLVHLVESRIVDEIIHIGADSADPYGTTVYKSSNRDSILKHSGSRYIPTAPLKDIRCLIEESDHKFAFVGKPCDIAALNAYLRNVPDIQERVLVTVSFFCAGVPSVIATHNLVRELGIEEETVTHIRYRGHGWPGQATVNFGNGDTREMSYEDSWGRILNKHLQFRCKICPDGIGSQADIVFGDAWHSSDGYPDFTDRLGESLILARTERGVNYLNGAIDNEYISASHLDLDKLQYIQRSQLRRRQSILPRILAMRLLRKPVPKYSGLHLVYCAWTGGPVMFIKQFAGMLRRILRRDKV